jgi:hypothetical protein
MFHSPGSCLLPKTRTEQTPSLLEGDMISAWLCKAPYVKDIFVSESAHEAALPINRGLYLWVSLGRVFTPEKKNTVLLSVHTKQRKSAQRAPYAL